MRAAILALLLMTALPSLAAPPSTCGVGDDYAQALCAYQKRDFPTAERGFRAIVERDEPDPRTIRSVYFLARTLMKQGKYDEASTLLIRIYAMDKAFYDAWACDFLLGECRRATGKG